MDLGCIIIAETDTRIALCKQGIVYNTCAGNIIVIPAIQKNAKGKIIKGVVCNGNVFDIRIVGKDDGQVIIGGA
jgi:hypothetical protein